MALKSSKSRQRSEFAQNIIRRRKSLGLTQAGLANKAKVSLNTIKSIEGGSSGGWVKTRDAIAAALGCQIGDLYKPLPVLEIEKQRFGSSYTSMKSEELVGLLEDRDQEISQLRNDISFLQRLLKFIDDEAARGNLKRGRIFREPLDLKSSLADLFKQQSKR